MNRGREIYHADSPPLCIAPLPISENAELKGLNSFGISAKARYLCRASSLAELREAFIHPAFVAGPRFFLGGGTNVLFTGDYPGFALKPELKGVEICGENGADVSVRVAAGESWPEFVDWSLGQGLYGLENLSLIPGTVGAAPVQNIGAYGREIGEFIEKVEALNVHSGQKVSFSRKECCFAYRESFFKGEEG
ncbi:MAG: FAD-binding protein, partial [Planctomycetes bacterium]|nr:FAD-binding protein [Planctomycetota bacterium]